MLGLGLNIVVGFAGLLDLGYAASLRSEAYTSALLIDGRRTEILRHLTLAVHLPARRGRSRLPHAQAERSDYLEIGDGFRR